ncbi:type VI secretion system Vgr family protein [Brucella endophytica]|nr:type VI secretion system tip protein TssI/VgrG [Brucella endophytica]
MPFIDEFIQASRVLKLSTSLGEDVLLPERASITEGVNQLFEIEIAVRSKKNIAPADLIGKPVDLELEVSQGEYGEEPVRRCWNGLVTELHEGPAVTRGLRSYHLVVRPSLWLLSQTRDSRIWMDQDTLQVLETLLKEHGLTQADTGGVLRRRPPIHYSCQFNESDLRYLLRRFEEEGYFYWFGHEKGLHRLHVANYANSWLKPEGDGRVRVAYGSSDSNHINEWKRRFTYVPGKRSGADWNYKTFGHIPIESTPSLVELPGNAKREIFEWPARAMDLDEARQVEKLRIQASEADHERVTGTSNVRILEPGRRFQPYDAANPDARFEEHVIIAAEHVIVDRSYETDGGSLPEYRNRFEAIPSRIPLTPHRTTPKPKIEGLQVAVVAGPQGEEIFCDSDGCVKLWFPWQRHRAKKDGTDTKWIRVSTNWAGQGWGGQVIPRIGMEVLVSFLDSDPDRPIVVGLVPNPRNNVPYPLPVNKTKTVFRTNTHKGQGFNELTFEDEKEREEVYVHAQKDQNIKVENNYSKRINVNKIESVGHNKGIEVTNNHYEVIGGDMDIRVGPSNKWTITPRAADKALEGIGQVANSLGSKEQAPIGEGNLHLVVQKNKTQKIGDTHTEDVGRLKKIDVGSEYNLRAGEDVIIEAGKRLILNCGKSRIVLNADGTITISGKKIVGSADEIFDILGDMVKIN